MLPWRWSWDPILLSPPQPSSDQLGRLTRVWRIGTPSESSTGASRVQGSITKTGNGHARRLLVEAAWHHARDYRRTKTLLDRWQLASPAARARGDAGNRRLHQRWELFNTRHKRPVIANVAVARELAGWCWSLAVLNE
nr:transposase [Propioniciclava tarda]